MVSVTGTAPAFAAPAILQSCIQEHSLVPLLFRNQGQGSPSSPDSSCQASPIFLSTPLVKRTKRCQVAVA